MTDGIFLINKEKFITSNKTLSLFKSKTKIKKAGILGILDPYATGVLPIVTGQALKYIQFIQQGKKGYSVKCRFGQYSISGDLETELTSYPDEQAIIKGLDKIKINHTLQKFMGNYMQTPPMYSSSKYKGKPLYKYARESINIERTKKKRYIFDLQYISLNKDTFEFSVICSSGTYIRTLVQDIAEDLNLHACMIELNRNFVEPFEDYTAFLLNQLDVIEIEKSKINIDNMLNAFQKILFDNSDIDNIYNGKPVPLAINQPNNTLLRIYNNSNIFCGLGLVCEGQIIPKRLMKR